MALNTDFDNFPYWDDYDEKKKYSRILFRPTTSVQARELTQLQTILQNQIERFGGHVFKDGSVVRGCTPASLPNLDFVRLQDAFFSGSFDDVTQITSDYLLVGQTSGVRATTVANKRGLVVNYPDTNRFYVKYIETGNNQKKVFDPGETILIYNPNQIKQNALDANNLVGSIKVITNTTTQAALGKGYGLTIDDGIVFHKGFFQLVDAQTIIVKDFDQEVGGRLIGFDSKEEIITEDDDKTLADNALGYPNENAPGAHRLRLNPYLIVREKTEIDETQSFFAVFEFSSLNNKLIINRNKNGYDQIGEVLSKRTEEESGDYVTKTFVTDTIKGDTPSTFYYTVSSGVGYVKGNRVEYLTSEKVQAERALTTREVSQQSVSANFGNFIYVNEVMGSLDFSKFLTIDIHAANSSGKAFEAVTSGLAPVTTGKAKIGTAKVKAVIYDSGDPGTKDGKYRLYISDIVMNSGYSFYNDARSFRATNAVNTFGEFYADIVRNSSNKAVIQESGNAKLVWPLGKSALRRLRSSNGSVNATEFNYRAISTTTMQTDGKIGVTVASSTAGGIDQLDDSVESGIGDVSERDYSVTLLANATTANITGQTVSISGSSPNITHGATLQTIFGPGEFIRIYANNTTIDYRQVVSVNTTVLVMNSNASLTNTAAKFSKHFPVGYNIPLNSSYSGNRIINVTSPTTFDIDVDIDSVAALESTAPVVVSYKMKRRQATQAKKDVAKSRYVKLWANAAVGGTWNLGICDVFNIRKVYGSTSGYSTAAADEITSYFTLDSGQMPDYYDHSKLVVKSDYEGTLGNMYLTVLVDHFVINTTNGVGFFSVDSYPIDDVDLANTSAISTAQIPSYTYGDTTIKLRDSVDFRPYKLNTATSATTLGAASENPTTTTSFVSSSSKYLVEPDTTFEADLEYYLGRKDLITINISGGLNVVKGTPSENPRTPQNNTDSMIIAIADVPPYPSLTYEEAELIKKPEEAIEAEIYSNRVYTMRDIGVLDQRIQNLEYYASLAALENSAKDLAVLDEEGRNRFKNGIFVDPMTSYDFHDNTNDQYRFTLDIGNTYGRSLFLQNDIDLEYKENLSSGIQRTGRYLTRPYTEELLIFQPFATKFRNNAQDFWKWNGAVTLFPGFDVNTEIRQGAANFEFRIFMAARTVCFVARGMRPNSRLYTYFDSTPVSQFCAPAAINTALGSTLQAAINEATRRGRPETALVRTGNFGSPLISNNNGVLFGIFNLPANTFRVGDRVFRVCDVDNLVLGEDAILTDASTIFTGFNISITFPPPPPPPPVFRPEPLAQSFTIDSPEGQSGVFVTRLELFFKKKDPNLGLDVVIVGMDAGVPNFRDVKGQARLESSQVQVSDDGSLGTTARFDFPIYLTADKQYAFYVRPDGNTPEYQMWVCEMGDFDTVTGAQVFRNPYSGDLFRSSNEITWTAYPTEDAKFNLYVANFEVGSGTAIFENEPDDVFTLSNINVLSPSNPIRLNNDVYKINNPNDITISTGYASLPGFVQFFDSNTKKLVLNNSRGAFRTGQTIGIFNPPQQGNSAQCNSTTLVATATINSVNNTLMHGLIPKMLTTIPSGTSINFAAKGTSSAGSADSDYFDVVNHNLRELIDRERLVYSVSNEQLNSYPKTFGLRATLNNGNRYVSPIIDLTSKKVVSIENYINNSSAGETGNYGDSWARYISKPVTLADRQDAEDFLLYLTAYRPAATDVLVYVKFLSAQDPGTLDSKVWTKLELENSSLRSSSANSLDWKEFVYRLPVSATGVNPTTSADRLVDGPLRYVDSTGAIYETYKSFVVKIVLLSSNKVYVPKVNDIRALALQL